MKRALSLLILVLSQFAWADYSDQTAGTFEAKRAAFHQLQPIKNLQLLMDIRSDWICQQFDPGIKAEYSDTYPIQVEVSDQGLSLIQPIGELKFSFQLESSGMYDRARIEKVRTLLPDLLDGEIEIRFDRESSLLMINSRMQIFDSKSGKVKDSGVVHECVPAALM